jgi:hypothetical protein
MASTTITFFPVDNGDMTLVKLGDKAATTLMIDCNIREAADDDEHDTRDVAADLRNRLKRDSKGRPYVDAFLLSHPDADHCRGLKRHFYLGPLKNYPDDNKPDSEKRIIIREMWSSPIVFRRASKDHVLSEDAVAFNTEAKRRVQANRDKNFSVPDGDRILVLGEDEDGKTDDLDPILVKVDETITRLNGVEMTCLAAHLLAPLPGCEDDLEEELTKNHSSVIINLDLTADESSSEIRNFLTGGDAEVSIWELLWEKHQDDPAPLVYDLMQTPHHCSWHSLSHDSWSELHEDAEVSSDARSALSQIQDNGVIVASSCPIEHDDNDPPCYGAKIEYESMVNDVDGKFYCTGEYPKRSAVEPLEFLVTDEGIQLKPLAKATSVNSLLRKASSSSAGLAFPNKPVIPNKPAGFA